MSIALLPSLSSTAGDTVGLPLLLLLLAESSVASLERSEGIVSSGPLTTDPLHDALMVSTT